MSEFREPPEGWFTFGTHVYRQVPLEFSEEEDEAGMPLWERPAVDLYSLARKVTDEVMGEGTYASINGGNPDPRVQAAIAGPSFDEVAERAKAGIAGPCALCGKDPAAGYASMWSASTGEKWYCHGEDDESPTCYERAPIVFDFTDAPSR